MTEKLQYIDENYLSAFAQQKVDSEVPLQIAFDKPIEIHKQYSIMQEESEKENTYLSYNACVGTSLDRKLYIAFDVLDYALCSAPGAVLKKALIDKGIGRDVYSEYENGIRQPFFSVVAKNADQEQKEEFVLRNRYKKDWIKKHCWPELIMMNSNTGRQILDVFQRDYYMDSRFLTVGFMMIDSLGFTLKREIPLTS